MSDAMIKLVSIVAIPLSISIVIVSLILFVTEKGRLVSRGRKMSLLILSVVFGFGVGIVILFIIAILEFFLCGTGGTSFALCDFIGRVT